MHNQEHRPSEERLPIRKAMLFGNANKLVNAFIGGWQLTGIYRWNTGFPIGELLTTGVGRPTGMSNRTVSGCGQIRLLEIIVFSKKSELDFSDSLFAFKDKKLKGGEGIVAGRFREVARVVDGEDADVAAAANLEAVDAAVRGDEPRRLFGVAVDRAD